MMRCLETWKNTCVTAASAGCRNRSAVTRARTCVTILGSEVTFEEMIRNKQEKERYTSLCQRIEEMNEQ